MLGGVPPNNIFLDYLPVKWLPVNRKMGTGSNSNYGISTHNPTVGISTIRRFLVLRFDIQIYVTEGPTSNGVNRQMKGA